MCGFCCCWLTVFVVVVIVGGVEIVPLLLAKVCYVS